MIAFFFSWLFFASTDCDATAASSDDDGGNDGGGTQACSHMLFGAPVDLEYDPQLESWMGAFTFLVWCGGNGAYWSSLYRKKDTIKRRILEDEQIAWLVFEQRKHRRSESASFRAGHDARPGKARAGAAAAGNGARAESTDGGSGMELGALGKAPTQTQLQPKSMAAFQLEAGGQKPEVDVTV
jgi:hypothetical protein